jgi:hypothetical protein
MGYGFISVAASPTTSCSAISNQRKTRQRSTPIYIEYNTAYGDNGSPTLAYCQGNGEIGLIAAYKVNVSHNLVRTNAGTGCSGYNIYGLEVSQGNNTIVVDANWVDGLNGNNTFCTRAAHSRTDRRMYWARAQILPIRRFHRLLPVAVPPMLLPACKP